MAERKKAAAPAGSATPANSEPATRLLESLFGTAGRDEGRVRFEADREYQRAAQYEQARSMIVRGRDLDNLAPEELEALLSLWDREEAGYPAPAVDGQESAAADKGQRDEPPTGTKQCGIEAPRFVWWQGTRYEFDVDGKPWELLVYLWGKPSVSIADIAGAVWKKKRFGYNSMKPTVTRLNQAIGRLGLPFTWSKNRLENTLVYSGPAFPSSSPQ